MTESSLPDESSNITPKEIEFLINFINYCRSNIYRYKIYRSNIYDQNECKIFLYMIEFLILGIINFISFVIDICISLLTHVLHFLVSTLNVLQVSVSYIVFAFEQGIVFLLLVVGKVLDISFFVLSVIIQRVLTFLFVLTLISVGVCIPLYRFNVLFRRDINRALDSTLRNIFLLIIKLVRYRSRESECCVCFTSIKNSNFVIILPCLHDNICNICCNKITAKGGGSCPMCRCNIVSTISKFI